ncbi:tetratricopeptide repeat protein [uncultured Draconibacterium sp.]|uniref:tetratricopeptide repeat protein n=1 Tax=uncultured Draconibacterium sp. TaxID=1573823 RepID=UPI0025F8DCB9|nr:tetratricopeptide repeat protein [uncultured Draconibacterium sp.]
MGDSTKIFFKNFWLSIKYLISLKFFMELFDSNERAKRDGVYRMLMIIISVFLLILMLSIVKDYGLSGDELNSHNQVERVYEYFKNGDTSAYEDTPGYLNLYGLSGNIIAETIAKLFPNVSIWLVRHYVNVLFGFLGIVFVGLIGLRLAGGLGGLISLIFMGLSPRYFGHSFNNLLDIPFAVGYIISIYYIIRLFDFWPKIKIRHAIGLILGISFSISNRAPGAMLYGYLLGYAGLFYIFNISQKEFWRLKKYRKDIFRFVALYFGIVIISYGLSLAVWPYGLRNPLMAIPNVLKHFSAIPVNMTTIFNGEQEFSNLLPRTYAPVYLFVGTPLFIGIGFIFSPTLFFKQKKIAAITFLFFTALFPVTYLIYQKANLYSGMRHLTFIVPSFVIIAALSWNKIIGIINKYYKIIPTALLIILMFLPLRHIIANHPNQYVYFNEIIGGMKGGYANYDMDYFYNSTKAGVNWLENNVDLNSDSLVVITHGPTHWYFEEHPNISLKYSRYYEKSREDWDYAIYSNVFINREQLLGDNFPPRGTIKTIDVDGYPVAIILKRLSKEDYKGFEALKQRRLKEAKTHFKNFLKVYPENEEVLEGYARTMLMERKLDSTIIYADSSIYYNPRQIGAWLLEASAYNSMKKWNEALEASNKMLDIKEEFAEGQFQKGIALKNLNKPNDALKAFQKAIAYKKDYYEAHMQMADILMNYRNFKKALELYNKVLSFRKDDLFAKVYSAKCYHLLNDNANATKLLNGLPERNFEVVKVKCRMAMQQNDWNNAGRYLNMARNINNNAELFVLRAQYLMMQKRVDLAKQNLDKAIELDPINREAQELQKSFTQTVQAVETPQTQQDNSSSQQSIMFQEPKEERKNIITFPSK